MTTSTALSTSAVRRPAVRSWACALTVVAAACGKAPALCEDGACPTGFVCNPDSGACEAGKPAPAASVGLLGRVAAVRGADGLLGVAAFSSERKSLIWLREGGGDWQRNFLAGPAAAAQEAPTGLNPAAAIDSEGRPHLAWRRAGDATLWYAVQTTAGWQTEQIAIAAAGTVGSALAIGVWQGQPIVAWRALDVQNVRVAQKQGETWQVATLPPPAALPGEVSPAAVDLGRSLALVVLPSGPAIAAYEATRGDLVLGARTGAVWNLARMDGVNVKTGEDGDDVGMPVAATLGPGAEIVIAYRNRTADAVMLLRSKAGVSVPQRVLEGQVIDSTHQTIRTDLLGTALSVVVLPAGLAVVAAQNASTLRIRIAAELPAGGFSTWDLPGGVQGWPTLVVQADATAACLWLEFTDPTRPGLGTLRRQAIPRGGE